MDAKSILWRAVTNFHFVNDQGQDVSVAVSQYRDNLPMLVLSAVASADGVWDAGQGIMASWWNTDEMMHNHTPVEMVWMKVQVNWIWVGTSSWFREGYMGTSNHVSDSSNLGPGKQRLCLYGAGLDGLSCRRCIHGSVISG